MGVITAAGLEFSPQIDGMNSIFLFVSDEFFFREKQKFGEHGIIDLNFDIIF